MRVGRSEGVTLRGNTVRRGDSKSCKWDAPETKWSGMNAHPSRFTWAQWGKSERKSRQWKKEWKISWVFVEFWAIFRMKMTCEGCFFLSFYWTTRWKWSRWLHIWPHKRYFVHYLDFSWYFVTMKQSPPKQKILWKEGRAMVGNVFGRVEISSLWDILMVEREYVEKFKFV